MAAIPHYMRNGEGIGLIAEEMGLDNETEPVAYHSCGFNTKSACTRLITPSFDSIPDAVSSIRKIEPEVAHFGAYLAYNY